jgi:hypothetical protein
MEVLRWKMGSVGAPAVSAALAAVPVAALGFSRGLGGKRLVRAR